MIWLHRLLRRGGSLFFRAQLDRDLEDEFRFHIDQLIEMNVGAGMPRAAARAAAMREFGGAEQLKEQCRRIRGLAWIESLVQDIRFALRILAKSPSYAGLILVTVALGIGATTAIFSVVNAVLLQPLPFHEPERLVMLWESNPAVGIDEDQVAGGNIRDWLAQSSSFERIGYLYNLGPWSRNLLLESAGALARIRGRYANSSFFEVFGAAPLLGRTFQKEEDLRGGGRSIVLSHALWRRHFAADPNAVGQTQSIVNGFGQRNTYTIIGVMPPEFRLPQDADIWLSWSSEPFLQQALNRRDQHNLWTFARLRDAVTVDQATAEMNLIQSRIAAEHTGVKRLGVKVHIVPLLDQFIGPATRPTLYLLFGAVGFVLLIACANVANLMLARAGARQKEIAVRTAMGAGRIRVIRQLLTESLLLSLGGGVLGLMLAFFAVKALGRMTIDETYLGVREFRVDRIKSVAVDAQVLSFTLLASIATGILFGLAPALQTARVDVNRYLKEEGPSATSSASRQRMHNYLLVCEVAVALMLLIGTSAMVQGLLRMQRVDTGVDVSGAVKFEVDLQVAQNHHSGDPPQVTFKIMELIRAMPGVVAVGAAGEIPLIRSGWQESLHIEGQGVQSDKIPTTSLRIVTPDLFRAMGVPILDGRDFSERDTANTPRVCVVNTTFCERFFPSQRVVGRRIALGAPNNTHEIVGVVGAIRNFSLESAPTPEVYASYRQNFWGGAELGPTFAVRTASDPMAAMQAIRFEIEDATSGAPIVGKVQTLDEVLGSSVAKERLQSLLMAAFSAVALLLAAVGIYGVMSWTVSQRTHEIGIRMALGAQPSQVLRMILGKGLRLTIYGVVIGLIGAYVEIKLLAHHLATIEVNPAAFIAIPLALGAVAMLACYLPARRATRVDPLVALRME